MNVPFGLLGTWWLIFQLGFSFGSLNEPDTYSGVSDWALPYDLPDGFTHNYGDIRAAVMVCDGGDKFEIDLIDF